MSITVERLSGRPLIAGELRAQTLVIRTPLSLFHGLDPESGTIVEPNHPDAGSRYTGKLLVLPYVKGATTSIALAESLRRGTGPAGLVLSNPDMTIVLASTIVRELYRITMPILLLSNEAIIRIPNNVDATLTTDGTVQLSAKGCRSDQSAEESGLLFRQDNGPMGVDESVSMNSSHSRTDDEDDSDG